jgi:hypothetical protein
MLDSNAKAEVAEMTAATNDEINVQRIMRTLLGVDLCQIIKVIGRNPSTAANPFQRQGLVITGGRSSADERQRLEENRTETRLRATDSLQILVSSSQPASRVRLRLHPCEGEGFALPFNPQAIGSRVDSSPTAVRH